MTGSAITETTQYLTYKLGDEIFAPDIDRVFSSGELTAIDRERTGVPA